MGKDRNRSSRREQNPLDDYLYGDLDNIELRKDPADKPPTEIPSGAPAKCAFCMANLGGKDFVAYSKSFPATAICCECVLNLAVMARFARETFAIWFQPNPDYDPLKRSILKRFFAHSGPIRTKNAIAEIAVRILQRTSAIVMKEKDVCRRTGVSLIPIRVALVGSDDMAFVEDLLRIACQDVGIAFRRIGKNELANGSGFELLKTQTNNESRWAEMGALLCDDYADPGSIGCAVIFACKSEHGIPDDVELIQIG